MKWMSEAKCRGKSPNLFDSDLYQGVDASFEASLLCARCPVQSECAADALTPINVSLILRNVLKVDLDEPDDVVPQSGTVRASVVM